MAHKKSNQPINVSMHHFKFIPSYHVLVLKQVCQKKKLAFREIDFVLSHVTYGLVATNKKNLYSIEKLKLYFFGCTSLLCGLLVQSMKFS
jgi:hypothetical protein